MRLIWLGDHWSDQNEVVIPGGTARLLALAVTYSEGNPANQVVVVYSTLTGDKMLLLRNNTNVDFPLSQVTEPEVDTAGVARAAPATVHPLVGGKLFLDVIYISPDIVVTVTAIVEV